MATCRSKALSFICVPAADLEPFPSFLSQLQI
jgi:hypothetical protein